MPTRTDGKIGVREYTSIVLLSVGLRLSDSTPSIFFQTGFTAAWAIPLLSYSFMAVPFFVMLALLKKHRGMGLMELAFKLTGRFGGVAIGTVLFLLTMLITVFSARNYIDILNMMVFQRTPLPALFVMLFGAAVYVASLGFETIGRTAWIVIPYIETTLVFLVVFVWQELEWYHLFPIAGPGVLKLAKESLHFSSFFGEMILFTAFVPLLRSYRDFRIASYIGFGFSCFKLSVMMTVFIAVFDFPAVVRLEYPFQQLTRSASIGSIVTHMESVFLAFWLITSVIHFAIYLFLMALLLGKTIRLQSYKHLIIPLAGLIVLFGLLPENMMVVRAYWDQLNRLASSVFLLLPFLLWGVDRLKGGLQR